MRRARPASRRENTIALINIVFLMLVFFMVAGTLAPPMDRDLSLVSTAELEGRAPPDALVVHPDGRLSYRGATLPSPEAFLAQREDTGPDIRIVPDRDLPAADLVALARTLKAGSEGRVMIVTERALP